MIPVMRIRLVAFGGSVAHQKEGVIDKTGLVRRRVIPCDVDMVVCAVDLDLVPLVVHGLGLHDLGVDAHLRQQVGIALGIAVAFALVVDHQVIDLARQKVARVECQLVVQDQRLVKVGHAVVDLVEIPLRARQKFAAHFHYLIGRIKLLRISVVFNDRRSVLAVFDPAPVDVERIDIIHSASLVTTDRIRVADKKQLRVRMHDGGKKGPAIIQRDPVIRNINGRFEIIHLLRRKIDRLTIAVIKLRILRNMSTGDFALELRRGNGRDGKHRKNKKHSEHARQQFFHSKILPESCFIIYYSTRPQENAIVKTACFLMGDLCNASISAKHIRPGADIYMWQQ